MSELYKRIFEEFKKQLEESMSEVSIFPLPFTTVNRLSMLAASVAEKIVEEMKEEEK